MIWRLLAAAFGVLLLATPQTLAQKQRANDGPPSRAESILKRFDKNKDGFLQKAELPKGAQSQFEKIDRNNDGKLDLQELRQRFRNPPQRKGGQPGEINTPPARGERVQTSLKVGSVAPDFTLPTLHGKKTITLSSYRGKKPVVLIFGSYT